MDDGVSFRELMAYTDAETERWHAWLKEQPAEVLQVRIGEDTRETVRDVIGHVFAAELRYTQRLLGEPETSYDALEMGSLDALWRIHAESRRRLRAYVDAIPAGERERQMTFNTRTMGQLSSSAQKMAVHVFLHGIRHWAQIATTLRQAGYRQPWAHDWLLCDAV